MDKHHTHLLAGLLAIALPVSSHAAGNAVQLQARITIAESCEVQQAPSGGARTDRRAPHVDIPLDQGEHLKLSCAGGTPYRVMLEAAPAASLSLPASAHMPAHVIPTDANKVIATVVY